MPHRVLLTADAANDLEDLFDFIREQDSPTRAAHVLDEIQRISESLAEFPDRDVYPKELSALGTQEYREVFFKPYRIVYQTIDDTVYVMLIADVRRDIPTLLARRLLGKRF
jgi:toxin ParE1/3/4